uniref:Putative secreted metalloprotease n=1 Tax=Ixodes ricinus TaxID=34613 RepID=A0A6B0VAW0_IXORI
MNAPKLRELLLLLLSASVSAAGESATGPEQTGCIGQATTETWYVGVYIVTDNYFRSCTPYKNHTLEEYLEAFVGGVRLYFQGLRSPAIEIVYLGSRNLTSDEENKVIGSVKSVTETAVKGGDAMKHLMVLPLTSDDQDITPGNKLLLVLTRLNITEEETKNSANHVPPNPESSESDQDPDYDDYGDEDSTPRARAAFEKKSPKNVGGMSDYGSICLMSGAIVQDSGSNFSGVANAAKELANVLGPMYNGTINRRVCSEDDQGMDTYHGRQCGAMRNSQYDEENFECLKDEINGTKGEMMTPHQFYKKHTAWTPCGTSYTGTKECKDPKTASQPHESCSLSCCINQSFSFLNLTHYDIQAPDGQDCESEKICLGGTCVAAN